MNVPSSKIVISPPISVEVSGIWLLSLMLNSNTIPVLVDAAPECSHKVVDKRFGHGLRGGAFVFESTDKHGVVSFC